MLGKGEGSRGKSGKPNMSWINSIKEVTCLSLIGHFGGYRFIGSPVLGDDLTEHNNTCQFMHHWLYT